jgi:hypothetical protein
LVMGTTRGGLAYELTSLSFCVPPAVGASLS